MADVTTLLGQLENGDSAAVRQLLPLVYDELHALVRRQRRAAPDGARTGTTSVVHEAYLRLAQQRHFELESRAQFFFLAAQIIRSILVDNARHALRAKRGGGVVRVDLDPDLLSTTHDEEIVALDAALTKLQAHDRRCYDVVVCRFFGGLEVEETAQALGVSPATVKRDWTLARTWLYRELKTVS